MQISLAALAVSVSIVPLAAGVQSDCEPASVEPVGVASPGGAGRPALEAVGAPVPGHPLAFVVSDGVPGGVGLLFVGGGPVSVPLPAYSAAAYVSQPKPLAPFLLDGSGSSAPLSSIAAVDPALCGLTATLQAGLFDASASGGVAVTHGLHVTVGAASGEELFPTRGYPLGTNPKSLGSADFDGDGYVDVLVSGNRVLLLPGNGTLDPDPAQLVFEGTQFQEFVDVDIADFDLDGELDLALVDRGSWLYEGDESLQVLLGNGDGSFTPSQSWSAPADLRSVASGDFDADGTLDLVLAQGLQGRVDVYLGHGDGTFGAAQGAWANGVAAYVACTDLNGDGHDDVAVGTEHPSHSVSVLLGRLGGALTSPVWYGGGGHATRVAFTDFDLDGTHDLLALAWGGWIYAFRGLGDGTFESGVATESEFKSIDLAVGDVEGDGTPEVAVATDDCCSLAGFLVYSFAPTGELTLEQTLRANRWVDSVAFVDLDGDSHPELLGGTRQSGLLRVFEGSASGEFLAPIDPSPDSYDLSPEFDIRSVFAHLDADPFPDLVRLENGAATWRTGAGDGSFGPPQSLDAGGGAGECVASDLDADGLQDLAFVLPEESAVSIVIASGPGAFAPPVLLPAGASPSGLSATDLDGDGVLDLLVENTDDGAVTTIPGLGGGAFGPAATHPATTSPTQMSASDLDGDGLLDLVGRDFEEATVFAMFAVGGGAYAAPTPITTTPFPIDYELGDLDADGVADLAVAIGNFEEPAVLVRLGQGDGTFGPDLWLPSAGSGRDVEFADLDGDGAVDIAFVERVSLPEPHFSGLSVYLGAGDGTFSDAGLTVAFEYEATDYVGLAERVGLADLDGDGTLDAILTTSGFYDPLYSVMRGAGDGTFSDVRVFASPLGTGEIQFVDFDGDGLQDVFVGGAAHVNRFLE